MSAVSFPEPWLDRYPTARYVTPFAVFIVLLIALPKTPLSAWWDGPVRVLLLAAVCYYCWPRELSVQPVRWLSSIAIGAGVFVLWIAPDLLFPSYRHSFLFSNALAGHLHSSFQPADLRSSWVLGWRFARAALIVPIVEELFWRAWLMRWLINNDFERVPMGAYAPAAFWITAILFASEHGPYWDVGLIAGIIYNLWMVKSKSVADCIVMHAVTNALLSAYVIAAGQWQYWQ